MTTLKNILHYAGLAAATIFSIVGISVLASAVASAQAAPQYNQQIIRQPMYTAPGQPPLIVPPAQDPYASSRAYIQNLPRPPQPQRCSSIPNGSGGYIQRCY
jgi:hypothetical protein